jgi:hypothetical protein
LLAILHGARAGDNREFLSAHTHAVSEIDDRRFLLEFPADKLVWLGYGDAFSDAGQAFEGNGFDGSLIARNADCGSSASRDRMRFETMASILRQTASISSPPVTSSSLTSSFSETTLGHRLAESQLRQRDVCHGTGLS